MYDGIAVAVVGCGVSLFLFLYLTFFSIFYILQESTFNLPVANFFFFLSKKSHVKRDSRLRTLLPKRRRPFGSRVTIPQRFSWKVSRRRPSVAANPGRLAGGYRCRRCRETWIEDLGVPERCSFCFLPEKRLNMLWVCDLLFPFQGSIS